MSSQPSQSTLVIRSNQGFLSAEVPASCVEAISKLESGKQDELVKKCVHAFIVLGQDKQPIKKSDISRLVFSTVTNYRAINGLIHVANYELQEVFGMKLYMIDNKSQPIFFLVNADLGYEQYKPTRTAEENHELTWLHFTLLEIFVSVDNRSTFDDIKKTLKPFEQSDNKDLIKDLLEKFVRQMFLGIVKHQEASFYIWGPRAFAEIDLEIFFQTFLRLSRETSREAWPDLVARLEMMKEKQKTISIQLPRDEK